MEIALPAKNRDRSASKKVIPKECSKGSDGLERWMDGGGWMSVLYGWVIGDGCTCTGTNRNSHRRKVAKQATSWEKIGARNKVPFGQRCIMCFRAYQRRRARRRVSGRRGEKPYYYSALHSLLFLPHCCSTSSTLAPHRRLVFTFTSLLSTAATRL